MPGTLGADYIQTSDGIINLRDLQRQRASAWVNFNGTGVVAIRDSFNVSSITDGGTGIYVANFAQPMANADYAVAMSANNNSAATTDTIVAGCNAAVPNDANGLAMTIHRTTSAALLDSSFVSAVCYGGGI